ncbi:hypothetical protein [uncultured Campylobacter sp.]|uniref:hypothetical protein n=1 Tax=uncultured Campylobacter sp. TaxID=218934 RepID=UPI00260D991E|nr:hypothetical protein [uncultured Campylobacter sp.]
MRIRKIFECNLYKISLFALFYKIIDLQYDIGILKFYDDEILEFSGMVWVRILIAK